MNYWCEDVLRADNLWQNHHAYLQACDNAFKELTRETTLLPFTSDTPTVVCVVRNEARRLPIFLEHYKKLGVKHFHIVDNNSSDQTANIAIQQSGITLWKTQASYAKAAFGQLWVGAIVRRFGLGKWVLNVDADELLVYADMESKSIAALQNHIESTGFQRAFTPLIDLYLSTSLHPTDYSHFSKKIPLFDGLHTKQPPYRFEDTRFGPKTIGGPRARMMAALNQEINPWLSKFSFAKWDSNTAYANIHAPYPFDRNPNQCFSALIHLKLLEDFSERVANAIKEREHYRDSIEYCAYQEWLDKTAMTDLIDKDISMIYEGPESLVNAKIIKRVPW